MRCATGRFSLALVCTLLFHVAGAQDLEPRRWTPLPPGLTVVGAGYIRNDGDVAFDPVLNVQDATVEGDTVILSYVRSFVAGGKRFRPMLLLAVVQHEIVL